MYDQPSDAMMAAPSGGTENGSQFRGGEEYSDSGALLGWRNHWLIVDSMATGSGASARPRARAG